MFKVRKQLVILAAIIVTIAGGLVAAWALSRFAQTSTDLASFGTFLSGTVAPLWSIAGLLLVYLAYLAQTEQITQQHGELAANNEAINRQRIESAFYSLLAIHHAIANAFQIEVPIPFKTNEFRLAVGHEAFAAYHFERFKSDLGVALDGDKRRQSLLFCYKRFDEKSGHAIAPYFGNIIAMIKLVDLLRDADDYVAILLLHLSVAETTLLFYYVILDTRVTDSLRNLFVKHRVFSDVRLTSELLNEGDLDLLTTARGAI